MSSKLSERCNVFPAGVWVSAAQYVQFMAVAFLADADGGEAVTAQLRKATDASGTNATDFGTGTTVTVPGTSPASDVDVKAAHDGRSDQLGLHASGLQFTHVSAQASDTASPETATGFLMAGYARSSMDNLAGEGLAGF